jgi:hypothetical protein
LGSACAGSNRSTRLFARCQPVVVNPLSFLCPCASRPACEPVGFSPCRMTITRVPGATSSGVAVRAVEAAGATGRLFGAVGACPAVAEQPAETVRQSMATIVRSAVHRFAAIATAFIGSPNARRDENVMSRADQFPRGPVCSVDVGRPGHKAGDCACHGPAPRRPRTMHSRGSTGPSGAQDLHLDGHS